MTQLELSAHTVQLHQDSIVIDAHSDILMAVADGRVELGERTVVEGLTTRDVRGHYDLPRWLEGGVTAQICALFIEKRYLHQPTIRALDMVASAYAQIAGNARLMLATTIDEIWQAKKAGKVALILSFEGADPLGGSLKYLPLFYRLGLRMASLTHARRNYFSGGVESDMDEKAGLTSLGKEMIKMMDQMGIVIDLRHMDARAIFQTLDITSNPVVMSHVNAREAFPVNPNDAPHHPFTTDKGVDRQQMLRDIGATGGVVCIIFWRQANVDSIVDDMCYVAENIGPAHVGLGTDYYGMDMAPAGVEDVSKFPQVTERLLQRGFSDEDVRGILGGNLMRVFEQVWKS